MEKQIMEFNALEARVWKTGGGSYVITLPKALIDIGLIKEGKIFRFKPILLMPKESTDSASTNLI